jgi:Flp pilus assembly protein TadB
VGSAHEIDFEIVVSWMASHTAIETFAASTSAPTASEVVRPAAVIERLWLVVMLLPGALTLFLSFRSGGFYLGAASLAAAEMAIVVGLRFALARRPLQGISPAVVVAAVAMGSFAAWTLISANWSDSVARAYPEYARALLYGLVLIFFGSLPFDVKRIRWIVYGVAGAIVVVCAAAIVARLLPNVILDDQSIGEPRLAYPLTYWNALGIVACIGTVLCAHLTSSTRDHWALRIAGAAAVPLLALTLYYTLSRGAIWAAPLAVLLYAAIGRPRAALSGAIAAIPPTLITIAIASPSTKVSEGYPYTTAVAGEHMALALGGCMLAAAALRAALLPLDGALDRIRVPRISRPALCAGIAAAALAVLLVGVAAGVPGKVETKYHEFTDRSNVNPKEGESRLLSARTEGRFDYYDVALDTYREHQLRGTGAGTFQIGWNRERPNGTKVENAHSLYIEVLAELGIVGLVLLLVALFTILGGFAYRARGPDRALFAALLAAGLAWAVQAGVDWDWQMPAVTLWLFALGGATLARPLRRRRRRHRKDLEMALPRVAGVLVCLVLALLPARLAVSSAHLNNAIEAVERGDCVGARSQAAESIDEVDKRPTPYQVTAFCDLREHRYRSAVGQMKQALAQDPRNWELAYGLAVARAGAGLDPRPDIRRVHRLNPNEPMLQDLPAGLSSDHKAAWKRAAPEAQLLPPFFGDP